MSTCLDCCSIIAFCWWNTKLNYTRRREIKRVKKELVFSFRISVTFSYPCLEMDYLNQIKKCLSHNYCLEWFPFTQTVVLQALVILILIVFNWYKLHAAWYSLSPRWMISIVSILEHADISSILMQWIQNMKAVRLSNWFKLQGGMWWC